MSIIVIIMVLGGAILSAIPRFWWLIHPSSFTALFEPRVEDFDYAFALFWIATAIPFCRWIYVAGTNVVERGHDNLNFTPGARIWWFFVPIASLYKPFEAMRELWNASHDASHYDRGAPVVTWWWTLWLGSTLSAFVVSFSEIEDDPNTILLIIDGLVSLALGGAAALLVDRITQAQRRPTAEHIAEIFA